MDTVLPRRAETAPPRSRPDIVLSACVMGVPQRAERHRMLRRALGVPRRRLRFSIDRRGVGPWANGERALRERHPDATHHLIVEDDAVVAPDFYAATMRILRLLPDDPVMLFATTAPGADGPYLEALAGGTRWVRAQGFWTVATVLPVGLIDPMLAWIAEHCHPDWDKWDDRLSCAAQALGLWSMVAIPNPATHDWSIPSTRGHDGMNAVWRPLPTLAECGYRSALDIDWSVGVDDPVVDPGVDHLAKHARWLR